MVETRWLQAAGVLAAFVFVGADAVGQPKSVQIGMAATFLTDKPKAYVDIATHDFKEVLKAVSGLDGVIHSKDGPFEVAAKLDKKELDFAILHGHEFAWLQKKYPDLEIVLIADKKDMVDRAYVVVHKTSDAKSIADLTGKKIDIPMGAGESCRLFLAKICMQAAKKTPAMFFSAIEKSASQNDGLDEAARGGVSAVVVDSFTLDFYKEVKGPVFAKNLRVLQESEPFPPAVIVRKKGFPDDATFKKFSDGLRKAHEIPLGRDMMKTWNMDAFEPMPKDFDKRLADILKAYPPPS